MFGRFRLCCSSARAEFQVASQGSAAQLHLNGGALVWPQTLSYRRPVLSDLVAVPIPVAAPVAPIASIPISGCVVISRRIVI